MPPWRSRLFANSIAHMLFRRATWHEAWLNLKRAHKDRRARKKLLQLALVVLAPFLLACYVAFLIGFGGWVLVLFALPVVWWIRRNARRADVPLNITPQPEPVTVELSKEQREALRKYIAELTLLYAIAVDRTGSEHYLKHKQLPENMTITSRQAHLELLRSAGLWDRITQEDREALMMPDGHWSNERIHKTVVQIEPLRLLRWILRIDFYLPVIGQHLQSDFNVAHELVLAPEKVTNGKALAGTDSLRTGRDAARQYFLRCLAEAISRGYHTPDNEKTLKWAKRFSSRLSGKQEEDLVLGACLVSEASKDHLLWATQLGRIRLDFLSGMLEVLESGKLPEPAFWRVVCD